MPGSGKSTLGVLIAKMLGKNFLDTDIGLQGATGMRLSEYIRSNGLEAFRRAEEQYLCSISLCDTVIATGGSAVYYESAMNSLKTNGIVVYLYADYGEIERRVGDLVARGVVMEKGQTLKDLYDQRAPLYQRYADVTVDANGFDISKIATEITKILEQEKYKD